MPIHIDRKILNNLGGNANSIDGEFGGGPDVRSDLLGKDLASIVSRLVRFQKMRLDSSKPPWERLADAIEIRFGSGVHLNRDDVGGRSKKDYLIHILRNLSDEKFDPKNFKRDDLKEIENLIQKEIDLVQVIKDSGVVIPNVEPEVYDQILSELNKEKSEQPVFKELINEMEGALAKRDTEREAKKAKRERAQEDVIDKTERGSVADALKPFRGGLLIKGIIRSVLGGLGVYGALTSLIDTIDYPLYYNKIDLLGGPQQLVSNLGFMNTLIAASAFYFAFKKGAPFLLGNPYGGGGNSKKAVISGGILGIGVFQGLELMINQMPSIYNGLISRPILGLSLPVVFFGIGAVAGLAKYKKGLEIRRNHDIL